MTHTPLRLRPEVEAVLNALDVDEWRALDEVMRRAQVAHGPLSRAWVLTCLETAIMLGVASRSADGWWSAVGRDEQHPGGDTPG